MEETLTGSRGVCWTRQEKKNICALSVSKRNNRRQTLMTAVAPACCDDTCKDAHIVPIRHKLSQRNPFIVTSQLLARSIPDQIAARSSRRRAASYSISWCWCVTLRLGKAQACQLTKTHTRVRRKWTFLWLSGGRDVYVASREELSYRSTGNCRQQLSWLAGWLTAGQADWSTPRR